MNLRTIPLALGLALAASVAVGCTEEDKLPARNPATAASSASSGEGGSGAESGDGGSGASADGGSGGDGSGGSPAYEIACKGDYAFQAVGATAQFPTPKGLYTVLNDLTYDPSTHPFGILLRGAPNNDAEVASSAIDAGAYVADAPTWGAISYVAGGFTNAAVLATGAMRVATSDGPIDIPLVEITVEMTDLDDECMSGTAKLDAIIPIAAADIELPTPDGPMTIEEIAGTASGPMGGNESGWTLRASFPVEATSFDWSAK